MKKKNADIKMRTTAPITVPAMTAGWTDPLLDDAAALGWGSDDVSEGITEGVDEVVTVENVLLGAKFTGGVLDWQHSLTGIVMAVTVAALAARVVIVVVVVVVVDTSLTTTPCILNGPQVSWNHSCCLRKTTEGNTTDAWRSHHLCLSRGRHRGVI
jgi:hypothetical protein